MAWKGISAEGETINDGSRNLKIGTFPYLITAAAMAVVKSDVTGKTQQVVIDLTHDDDYHCKLYLGVMSDNDVQREIAEKTLRGVAQACGIAKGLVKPETLKKLVGNSVLIEANETVSKADKTKKYINVKTIEAYDGEEEEEEEEEVEEEEAPAPKTKKPKPAPEPEEEEEEEVEEDEEEEEEEEPAPKKPAKGGKKATPW